jgi:hypothetical protein
MTDKSGHFTFRASADELQQLQAAATHKHMSLSAYLRDLLVQPRPPLPQVGLIIMLPGGSIRSDMPTWSESTARIQWIEPAGD